MDMRVEFEFLIPGMQHAKETDLRAEVFRITRDFKKRLRTGAKQEIVHDLLVLQSEWCQLTRQRENNMHIACREKLLATRCEPAVARPCLTLRAVPVAARVVGDGAMPAAGAFIEMATECGGATPPNGQQHFHMLRGDPLTASFDECVSRGADQIGHLERWSVHLPVLW